MPTPIEEIKQRLDIVDLIQEYIKLTPAGSNFKAKCPFHNEKTPSFIVSPERQIWHCFGCGLGGDQFEFIKRIEGLEFPEALRILADKANVKLDYHNPELHSHKTKLLDINNEIASYWHQKLLHDQSAGSIRKYLAERGVSDQSTEEFLLGDAADSWDDGLKYLQNKGYSLLEIAQAGLSVTGDKGRPYDRFRGRLIFPIRNIHGSVVGFGARKMKEDDPAGKYLNSPQTEIYNKSEVLYNLDQAKVEIKRLDYVILVEGYMDVLACHQAGTKNVVSVSGTALTDGQIKTLKRYTQNVMIAFDADVAGVNANLRGIDLAWQAGLNVKVIHFTEGKDPDEVIKKDKELWRQAVAASENFLDYIFKVTLGGLDLSRVDHKKKAAQKLLKVIAKLGDEVEIAHYLKKLAKALDVTEESLQKVLARIKEQIKPAPEAVGPASAKTPAVSDADIGRALIERFLCLLLKFPVQIFLVSQRLEPEAINDKVAQEVYKKLIIYYNKEQSFNYENFTKELLAEEAGTIGRLMMMAEIDQTADSPLIVKEEFDVVINRLNKNHLNKKIKELGRQMAQAEKAKDQESVNKLSEEFSKLVSRLREI